MFIIKGEVIRMKGDFSRDTFDHKKHYRRVLMQQGRVQVDADWNEQASILLQYMQSLARDIIGPYGRPSSTGPNGEKLDHFRIIGDGDSEFSGVENGKFNNAKGFLIGPGHYYVDGLLCENEDWIAYNDQTGGPLTDINKLTQNRMLVYLDVWERHIAWCEEASNSMREVALGLYGPDTATRSQLVWQVRIHELETDNQNFITTISRSNTKFNVNFEEFIKEIIPGDRGRLSAITQKQSGSGDKLCAASPSAKYLGLENQLYRVEIHQSTESGKPTFKWSRDNGSSVFPVIEGKIRFPSDENDKKMYVELAHLGLDESKALKKGDWVEFVHESYVLQNRAESLLQVENIDLQTMEVTLVTKGKLPDASGARLPILRRWDQCESKNPKIGPNGDIPIKKIGSEGDFPIEPDWIDLEDGIQIKFEEEQNSDNPGYYYRTGDYWLIPARVATKDIEWIDELGGVSPHGIEHHYAPLAILTKDTTTSKLKVDTDYEFGIKKLPLKGDDL
ncbi:MAG: DUF6519 domain-containing protein [Methanothrix soehngenii]|nr:DUF6519 domain-containing protein [Methanothrix soehngenii]